MVADLTDASGDGNFALESLMFGGAPAPDSLAARAHTAFPSASMSQGYGLTETSSVAVGFAGEDYIERPKSWYVQNPLIFCFCLQTLIAFTSIAAWRRL